MCKLNQMAFNFFLLSFVKIILFWTQTNQSYLALSEIPLACVLMCLCISNVNISNVSSHEKTSIDNTHKIEKK